MNGGSLRLYGPDFRALEKEMGSRPITLVASTIIRGQCRLLNFLL
jgi:hypothetical protein